MKVATTILFSLLSLGCFAQKITIEEDFIKQYFDSIGKGNYVVDVNFSPQHFDTAQIRFIKEGCALFLPKEEINRMVEIAEADKSSLLLDKSRFSQLRFVNDSDITFLMYSLNGRIITKPVDSALLKKNRKIDSISVKYKNPEGIYFCSKPIFDKKYQYAIFTSYYYCGNLCGFRSINLYKIENGRWTSYEPLYSVQF